MRTLLFFSLTVLSGLGLALGLDAFAEADAETVAVQLAEEEESEEELGPDYLCEQVVLEGAPGYVDSYEAFMDEYFQVDTPSADQLEEAMERYRQLEEDIYALYEEGVEAEGFSTVDVANDEVARCVAARDQTLDYSQMLLEVFLLQSAYSKRSFEMVDGLKAFNESLDELSGDFYNTFPALFDQMDSDLPCYARQCVTN